MLAEAEQAYRDAIELCDKLVIDFPDVPNYWWLFADTHNLLGNALKEAGKLAEAAETYRDAVELWYELATDFPDVQDHGLDLLGASAELGNILRNTGQLEEAVKVYQQTVGHYTKAIELDPNNPHHWYARGRTYTSLKQWDEAVTDYSKAIELKPDNWDAWDERFKAYLQIGQQDKGLAELSEAIELDPDNPSRWQQRGNAYLYLGQWSEMAADYTRAIELAPNGWWFWHERGYAYMQLGQWDKVAADYSKAIELEPKVAGCYSRRAAAYQQLGQWDEALEDYSKTVELDPDKILPWYYRSLMVLAQGDIEGYRQSCQGMLEHFGQTEEQGTAHWVAWTCVLASNAAEDLDQVVKLAEQGSGRDDMSDQYLNTLGAILYRAGRFDEAVQQLSALTSAWEQGRGFSTGTSPGYTWFFMAMAHHQLGNSDEAKSWFDKAVQRAEQEMQSAPSWNRQLTLQLLRKESEPLINGEEVPPE
jgi:tetratricopeptide (TPR) repeat protein